MIERLLRKEMTLRFKFLEEREKRDEAEKRTSRAFAELQEAKRELFRAGFKGNIMRGIRTLEELKAANPHTFTPCDELGRSFTTLSGEYVTRQNAEEVIAAKDAEIAELKKLISSTHKNAVKHTECEAVNCPICEGGLFVCADCGAVEIETEQKICTGSMATLEAENKRLREALEFYKNGFSYHPKRTKTGIDMSAWKPTEKLLDDCGETARAVLAEVKP